MRDTALGGLNLKTKTSKLKHTAARLLPPLVLGRASFLALIRLNIWGMATLFSQKLFFVSDAVTATQKEPYYWWDLGSDMAVGWYNLGGDWDSFKSAVNAGKNKKARLFALAPKAIKEKFAAQGITGQGIGEPVSSATLTLIGTAATVVIPLIGLITIIISNSNSRKMLEKVGIEDEKERQADAAEEALRRLEAAKNRQFELDRIKAEAGSAGDGFSFTDADGKVTTAGYGIIGAGILGMLFLGTMKKNKSKK